MKAPVSDAELRPTVTAMLAAPAAPGGVVAVIVVGFTTVTPRSGIPPIVAEVWPARNSVPTMVPKSTPSRKMWYEVVEGFGVQPMTICDPETRRVLTPMGAEGGSCWLPKPVR